MQSSIMARMRCMVDASQARSSSCEGVLPSASKPNTGGGTCVNNTAIVFWSLQTCAWGWSHVKSRACGCGWRREDRSLLSFVFTENKQKNSHKNETENLSKQPPNLENERYSSKCDGCESWSWWLKNLEIPQICWILLEFLNSRCRYWLDP